jgi:beta-galactosidase
LSEDSARGPWVSRRGFLRKGVEAAVLFSTPVLRGLSSGKHDSATLHGPVRMVLPLDQHWLFGGKLQEGALEPGFDDAAFIPVTLPNTVTPLSWQNWNPAAWEGVWVYRRHFAVPSSLRGLRIFLHFDRVMFAAQPVLNGHVLPPRTGGFLPFEYEITHLLTEHDNVLAVSVDARWNDMPPAGSPLGPSSIDYLLPGGICGGVSLRAVPTVFLRDVFARPVDVLRAKRRVEVTCRVDADGALPESLALEVSLQDGGRTIANTRREMQRDQTEHKVSLALDAVEGIVLWDVEQPKLYEVVSTLLHEGKPLHVSRTRIGLREACFELDGFFLNGKRLQLFGLNRHELYPYFGFSVPPRLARRDAELLRRTLNCNIVRCSHYPQSEAFLDACDELGLLVWEEIPGWQYLGDKSWREIAVRNVEEMVLRDRNHPSIVIWGTRINESANDPELYRRTRDAAKRLDDSRPTSGTMTDLSMTNWHEDVFAFDDYHADPVGSVGINAPLEGVPYMVAEAVGQFAYNEGKGFGRKYQRTVTTAQQMTQALWHAEAHNRAAESLRNAGLLGWCAFDYASLRGGSSGVKWPGIADVFRLPKLGATFYLAQIDPRRRVVMEPNFYWDFGPGNPSGPGRQAAIFSNCERIELTIDGRPHAVLHPAAAQFPHLRYPPFFSDLELDGSGKPELRMDGYLGERLVLSRSFSSDSSADKLWLQLDDAELQADGADMTRLAFAVVDRFGSPRPFAGGKVSLTIEGPAVIVGDNPFALADNGGSGAVWIKTMTGREGKVRIEAQHDTLGTKVSEIIVRRSESCPEQIRDSRISQVR